MCGNRVKEAGGTIGKIYGRNTTSPPTNLRRMNMLLHGVKDTEFEITTANAHQRLGSFCARPTRRRNRSLTL